MASSMWVAAHALGFPAGGNQFPLFLSATMALIGAVMVAMTFVSPQQYQKATDADPRNSPRLPLMMAGLVSVYVLVSFSLGYYVATAAFLVGAPLIAGFRRGVPIAVCAIVCVALIYGLFDLALQVRMPQGVLF